MSLEEPVELGNAIRDGRTIKVPRDRILAVVEGTGGPLIRDHFLTCPACEVEADILSFIPLEHSAKYADQIVVPLKCRNCRHVFALRP